MSRSYRKNPFGGITTAASEKWDKRHANRKLRHANKSLVKGGEDTTFIKMRESTNVWSMGKDGKTHFPYPQKDSHTIWMARFYGITEEEALERERKCWLKYMRK